MTRAGAQRRQQRTSAARPRPPLLTPAPAPAPRPRHRRSIPGVAELRSPHEAEFRSYYILMQMGIADSQKGLLAMLAALPLRLLASPEVQHALACWSALANTNTSRFFKLVKEPGSTRIANL